MICASALDPSTGFYITFVSVSLLALVMMMVVVLRGAFGKKPVEPSQSERTMIGYLLAIAAIAAVMMFWAKYNG